MNQDINFSIDKNRFNYRVAAYIRTKDKILLQKSFNADFYNFIGGRVKLGESSKEAMIREFKEETGIDIVNPKLMVVGEMFFDWLGKEVQEMVFIYKVELDEDIINKLDNSINQDSKEEIIQLIDFKNLKNIKCKPEIIYKLETYDENKITHYIHKD